MTKPDVKTIINVAKATLVKYSPEILTGIGITGMITTTVLAVKATPKALEKIEEKKQEVYDELDPNEVPAQGLPEDVKLTKKEIVAATWKCYIPAAVTATLSVACIIGASKANLKRNAALATAYNLSQTALTEYQAKVAEVVGEEKEKEIRRKANDETARKYMTNDVPAPVMIGSGEMFHCIDAVGQQRFKANELTIREALVRLNNRLRDEMTISLNDFYDEIGVGNIPLGDSVGWYVNKVNVIEPYFDIQLIDNVPHIVVDFLVRPDYDYNDYR